MDIKNIIIENKILSKILLDNKYIDKKQYVQYLTIDTIEVHMKNTMPKATYKKANHFILFLKRRVHDIILCELALKKKFFNQKDFDRVLITQRSIFLLKGKVIPLIELLITKGVIQKDKRTKILDALEKLQDKQIENYLAKAINKLASEDASAVKWREQHIKGITGVKYVEDKTVQLSDLDWYVKSNGVEDSKKNGKISPPSKPESSVPPSKLESSVPPSKLESSVPPSKLEDDMPPSKLEDDMPPSKLESSVPPSKLEDDMPPSKRDEQIPDIAFDSFPGRKKKTSYNKIAFALTGVLCILIVIFIIYLNNQEIRSFNDIQYLRVHTKDYDKIEKKCRAFLKDTKPGKRYRKVQSWLQEIQLKLADIYFRQGKYDKAKITLQEILRYKSKNEISNQARQLLVEISNEEILYEKRKRFESNVSQVRKRIQNYNFSKIMGPLTWIEKHAKELGNENILLSLKNEVKVAKEKYRLSKYKYYQVNQLKKTHLTFPFTKNRKKILRIPLGGEYAISDIIGSKGHFFMLASGYLYALKVSDGSISWVKFLGGDSIFRPIFIAGPREYFNLVLVKKILVVSQHSNSLIMLDVQNGKEIWEKMLPGVIATQPVLYKGKVYVNCMNKYCYKMDILNGQVEGAYMVGEIPVKAPSFDKKRNLLYIQCKSRTYIYDITRGQLILTVKSPKNICSPIIAVSPYYVSFSSRESGTKIDFHLFENTRGKWESKFLKSTYLHGKMKSNAKLAGGMLTACSTTHLAIYGINPITPKDAFFSLTETGGIPLENKGTIFVEFANCVRNLLVLQKDFHYYTIKNFDVNNALQKKFVYSNSKDSLKTYLPVQRYGNYYFWSQKSDKYYQGTCLRIDKDGIVSLWKRQIAPSIWSNPIKTKDGRIFFHTNEGHIHELFLNKKKQISHRILAHNIVPRANTLTFIDTLDGYLLFPSKKNSIEIIDSVSGWNKKWKNKVPFQGRLGKLAFGNDTIFSGTSSGVFAFSFLDGKKNYLEFVKFQGKPFLSQPLYYKKSLFIGSDDGALYKLKLKEGSSLPYLEKKWIFQTKGRVRSSFCIFKDTLYFGSDDGFLYALDVGNGSLKWKWKTGGAIKAKPVIHNNSLYIGSQDRNFYALDLRTGKLLWKKQLLGRIDTHCLVYNNAVCVVSVAGELKAYDLQTGKVSWETQLGGPIKSAPITLGKYLIIGNTDGFIYLTK